MAEAGEAADREAGLSPDTAQAQPGRTRTKAGAIPASVEIVNHACRSKHRDNSFARVMAVVKASQYYQSDLSEQDVLEFIPRGLALSQKQ